MGRSRLLPDWMRDKRLDFLRRDIPEVKGELPAVAEENRLPPGRRLTRDHLDLVIVPVNNRPGAQLGRQGVLL